MMQNGSSNFQLYTRSETLQQINHYLNLLFIIICYLLFGDLLLLNNCLFMFNVSTHQLHSTAHIYVHSAATPVAANIAD